MDLAYDPNKRQSNLRKHGIDFKDVRRFDFLSAWIREDRQCDYGETRWIALGLIDRRLHVLCFTETTTGIRVISLRNATRQEVNAYAHR